MTVTLRCLAAAASLTLAACQSGGPGGLAGGTPAGVPIAVESIEGAPPAVQTALSGELQSAAASRRVDLVGAQAQARYRVKGYLSAQATDDGGTALAVVWDVFDEGRRRAKRVTGTLPVRAASTDPWDGLDKEALRRLAAQSMDDFASFIVASNAAQPAGEAGALGYTAP